MSGGSRNPAKGTPLHRGVGPAHARPLRVLVYHRVADPEATPALDPALISVSPDGFRRQMRHLAHRYSVVSLEEVLAAFRGIATLPERAVLITFDDAYRDVGEIAWPILKGLRLPATLFVPTAYPGRPERAFWWDRLHRLFRRAVASSQGSAVSSRSADHASDRSRATDWSRLRRQMKGLTHEEANEIVDELDQAFPGAAEGEQPPNVLDWDELRALAGEGLSIGAHTRWHPPLPRTSKDRIRSELKECMEDLQGALPHVAPVIAYPYGFHDRETVQAAREEGFELGFTCLDGLNHIGVTDPLRLRRTNVTRSTTPLIFRLRMRPWFSAVDRWRHRFDDPSGVTTGLSAEGLLEALNSALSGNRSEGA